MKNIAYIALALVLALAAGFATGWHAKGVSVTAAQSKAEKAQTTAIVAGVNKEAAAQHTQLVAEQGKTLALDSTQQDVRSNGVTIEKEINHAIFIPYEVPSAAVSCPDPAASPQFVRLYNAAAAGNPAAAASTSAR
ncbi:MAG: hypothetical protein WA777_18520 [Rhodanobacter sp.]